MRYIVNPIKIKMKKAAMIFFIITESLTGYSQNQVIDSLKEVTGNLQGKLNALDERVLLNEADLGKLNKIKISGYIQSQFEAYGKDLENQNGYASTFLIRRARIKFTYEALDGVKFVLQPDFSTNNLSLKDAYAVINIPKIKDWTLWAGQINRPDYEVEYSSGQREVPERSRMIRAIYPGEREIGAKLEYNGSQIPLKFQFMAMNGNFTGTQAKDFDSGKDFMVRLVYSVRLPGKGLSIDFGPDAYFGSAKPTTNTPANPNNYYLHSDATLDSLKAGSYLDKRWYGGEIQIFADILGGASVKAEYIEGVNTILSSASILSTAPVASKIAGASALKNFSGYYLYFIKNIGLKNQFVARYDFYDPNNRLSGDQISKTDLYYKTLTLAWQYYLNDWIRISLSYEMPKNETNTANPADIKDNTLVIRVQAKF
jgi:hypothetical protein